jgi:abortive infection bacteriophage resistance protein
LLTSQLQQIKNSFSTYNKPHLSFEEQVKKLKSNGLIIPNDSYAIKKLSHTNYYRLSAYCIPFQYSKNGTKPDQFYPDVEFNHIISLYDFDAKLRRLVFGALEVIEVYIRTQIAYVHGAKYKPFGYLLHENLECDAAYFDKLTQDIKDECNRSDEKFIEHFRTKYNTTDLPLWSVVEILSLGTLSRLFSALKSEEQQAIADTLNVKPKALASWLHSLTIVRNRCAHHSRLWNVQLRIPFAVPSKSPLFTPLKTIKKIKFINGEQKEVLYDNNASVFFALSVMKFILDGMGEEVDFITEVKQLITEHSVVDLKAMGFVDGWESLDIWSDV